jgi:hypothetical protein
MPPLTRRFPACLLVLCGCSTFTLDQVPIDGGTEAQRAAARAALLDFDTAIGAGRLALRSISFRELKEPIAGRYHNARVDIYEGAPAEVVGDIARHELCHALDDAESLSGGPQADALERLAEGPLAHAARYAENHPEHESFALLCEQGPIAAGLYASSCPGDFAATSAVFAWMETAVWSAPARIQRAGAVPVAGASWTAAHPPEIVYVTGVGEAGRALRIIAHAEGLVDEWGVVDVHTGEPADPEMWREPGNDLEPEDIPPEHELQFVVAEGWQEGPGVVVAQLLIDPSTYEPLDRIALWDGTAIQLPAEPCWVSGRTPVFAADGHVWRARIDGATVSWSRMDPDRE